MTEPEPPPKAKSQIPKAGRRRIDEEGILTVTLARKGRLGDSTYFKKKLVMGWGAVPDEIVRVSPTGESQFEFARCTVIMSNGTSFYVEEPVEEITAQMFEGH